MAQADHPGGASGGDAKKSGESIHEVERSREERTCDTERTVNSVPDAGISDEVTVVPPEPGAYQDRPCAEKRFRIIRTVIFPSKYRGRCERLNLVPRRKKNGSSLPPQSPPPSNDEHSSSV
jgi:hypothetical protein